LRHEREADDPERVERDHRDRVGPEAREVAAASTVAPKRTPDSPVLVEIDSESRSSAMPPPKVTTAATPNVTAARRVDGPPKTSRTSVALERGAREPDCSRREQEACEQQRESHGVTLKFR
jgi:hypothetical protein